MRVAPTTILLGVAACAAPIAIGSVHTTVVAILALPLVVAAGLTVAARRDEERRGGWISLMGLAFASMATMSALQLIPLPVFVHDWIQWEGARLWREGWALVSSEAVPWRPLSLDPHETADRGLRWVALTAAAVAAANATSESRWRALLGGILAAGVATMVVGAALRGTDPTTFFGLYTPSVSFRGPSTFVSTNHAATFYGLCSLVGFGFLLLRRRESPVEASLAGALGFLFVALAAIHDSTAVMAAYGIAIVVFLLGLGLRTEGGGRLRESLAVATGRVGYVVVMVTALVILAWWVGLLDGAQSLVMAPLAESESALNRTALTKAALVASADFPLVGAGGGAVDVVAGRYIDWRNVRPASIPVVENDPAEWLLTYGWIVGGLTIVALLAQLGCAVRRLIGQSRGTRWVVAGSLAVFGAGVSLFHFPFFALGIAIPMVIALEATTAPRRGAEGRSFSKSGHVGAPWGVMLACVILLGVSGTGFFAANQAWAVDLEAPASELVRARPTDGRIFAELASRAVSEGPEGYGKGRELARHNVKLDAAPDARIFLARMLGQTGADEESAEIYAELLGSEVEAGLVSYSWLVADLQRPEHRAWALSQTDGARLEQAIKAIAKSEGPEAATDVVVELADIRSDDPAFHRAAISTFLALRAWELAELWASNVTQRGIEEEGVRIGPGLEARVALAQGASGEAAKIAARAMKEGEFSRDVALVFLEKLPPPKEAEATTDEAVDRALASACQSPLPKGDRDICWHAEAWRYERAEEWDDALLVYERIARRLDDPAPLARYFVRHGKCLELRRFIEGLGSEGARSKVERIAKRCGG